MTMRKIFNSSLGLLAVGLLLGVAPLDPTRGQESGPCMNETSASETANPDLYCISLIPTPRVFGASGVVELRRPVGPFSVAATRDGHLIYNIVLTTRGLPPPSE